MDINLGTIQIQPKGAWESTVAYEYLNLIRYNNNSYICRSKIGAPTGTLPTDTNYFMHITADGIDAQEIQLQKTATEIQWKRTGDITWTTLVALSAIKGDKGDKGLKGDTGLKGDKGLKGDTGLKGDKGDQGPNTIWQYSADNITWATSVPDGVRYMRESTDNGTTWSTAIELPSAAALALKAPLASPTFTGDVIVPDQKAGNNSTKAANTKYVDAGLALKANTTDVDDALALKANSADVADALALILELENQNTLAEAILQENLLINNIYDRLEGGIYAAI